MGHCYLFLGFQNVVVESHGFEAWTLLGITCKKKKKKKPPSIRKLFEIEKFYSPVLADGGPFQSHCNLH